MALGIRYAIPAAILFCSTNVLAQPAAEVTGTIPGWLDGEARIVLLAPRQVPPPLVRPDEAPAVGAVAEDGTFTLTVPPTFPEEEFVPVARFLDPSCSDIFLEPPEATYFPIIYGVYRGDGTLVGEIFRGSAGAARGPLPGEYSTMPGYAEQPFTLRGTCPDPRRPVVEQYDFAVEAGWHEIVQSFTEHPDIPGWRVDHWRNETVPEQAVWILIRPPH